MICPLTASSELVTGTAGNDTFLALNNGDLSANDIVNGGNGTDTVFAAVTTGASSTLRPVLSGVEIVELEITDGANGGTTNTLNMDKSSGIQTVNVHNFTFDTAADTIALTNVTTATSLKISDDAGHATARANNYTVSYTDVSGTADSASVEVNSTTAATALGTITVAGVETLTVSSTGGAGASYALAGAGATTVNVNASAASGGTASVTAAKATTLNITSAADLTVSDATNGLVKVGVVNIDSQTAAKTVTVNDIVTTNAAATTETLQFNVQGAGNVELKANTSFTANNAAVAEDRVIVSAAESTGRVSYTTNTSVANLVTTGSGNDTVTLAGALDADDVIDLGAGSLDRIVATATYTANAEADVFYTDATDTDNPVITGVEVAVIGVGTSSANSTLDVTSAAFASTLALTGTQHGTDTLTVNNITAGQTVALGEGSIRFVNGAATILNVKDAATNTADVLNIVTDVTDSSNTATLSGITAENVETVSVDLASTATDNTTVAAGNLTFADATSVTLTGAKITTATVTAKDGATIDATGVTGATTLTVDNNAKDYTLKGSATAATTFVMGAQLDDGDTIVGGAAATDVVRAQINGLAAATTGALHISGVETLELDAVTGASTLDMAGVTGVSTIKLDGSVNVTMSNLSAGTGVALSNTPNGGSATQYTGTLTVGLADATGSADSLDVQLTGTGTSGSTLVATGIENLNLKGAENAWTAGTLDVSGFAATTITVTGVDASSPAALDLRGAGSAKLNAATSTVDASAFDGAVKAIAATNTATTFKSKVAGSTFTGSVLADTVVVGAAGSEIGAAIGTINTGAGSDTVTAYVKGSADLTGLTNAETVNLVLSATAGDYTSNAFSMVGAGGTPGSSPTGIQTALTTNISGGLAGTTVTLTGDLGDSGTRTIDASAALGSIALSFAAAGLTQSDLSDAIVIKGGQGSTDQVTAVFSDNAVSNTGVFTMSGVEKMVVKTTHAGSSAGADVVDLKNVTGLTTLALTTGTSNPNNVTVNNLAAGVVVALGNGTVEQVGTATLNLASSTGSADALTVRLVDTDGTGTANTIAADGVETLTLELIGDGTGTSGEDHKIAITDTNTNNVTVVVNGTDTDTDLTLSSLASSINAVDASAFKSALSVDTGAIGSGVYTITGGEGNDIIGMKNAASVLDGGTKTSDNDTLNISFSGTGGALIVDLSSSTDQVQMFNGLANAAVQKNFESVNASAYVQTNSVGADITGSTGANTIVGTAYADTIRAGEGNDVITGGAGADAIDVGTGTDRILITAAGQSATYSTANVTAVSTSGMDIITGLAAGDTLQLSAYTGTAAGTAANQVMDTDEVTSADISAVTLADNSVHFIRGNYSAGLFTESTTGADTLFVYDADSDVTNTAFNAVVLIGVGGATFAVAAGTGGIVDIS